MDFVYAKVEVTVRQGKIVKLGLLEHKQDRGASSEQILEDIVEQQRLDVDAVTGATNSSKVIRKAIENALMS